MPGLVPALVLANPIHNDLLVNHYGLDWLRLKLALTLAWVNGWLPWQYRLLFWHLYWAKLTPMLALH